MSKDNHQASMRAVVAQTSGVLSIEERPIPVPESNELLVRVKAISLNAGDTRSALAAEEPYVPGWDFSGEVLSTGTDVSSPAVGTRVAGVTLVGGWAQYVAVPASQCAVLPDDVSFQSAAALPVAGITAITCIKTGGDLFNKRVLITGAAGGVGRYACQLADLAGAQLHAVSRRKGFDSKLAEDGVTNVTIFNSVEDARNAGEYDFIIDSVGGQPLAEALRALAPDGICVNCGNSTSQETSLDIRDFYLKDGVQLHGLYLGRQVVMGNSSNDLAELANMVSRGLLRPPIGATMPWIKIAEAASSLENQEIEGKIVLVVD